MNWTPQQDISENDTHSQDVYHISQEGNVQDEHNHVYVDSMESEHTTALSFDLYDSFDPEDEAVSEPAPASQHPAQPVPDSDLDTYDSIIEAGSDQQHTNHAAHPDAAAAIADAPALLAQLLAVAADLAASPDMEALVQQSLVRSIEALPIAQAGMLWLYDARSGKLRVAATHRLPLEPELVQVLTDCQINPGENLLAQVLQRNTMLIIESLATCSSIAERIRPGPRYADLVRQMRDQLPHVLPIIFLPLCTPAGESIGLMVLLHLDETVAEQPDPQGSTEPAASRLPALQEVLPTYARLVASLIHNKQLYEQSQLHCRRLDAFDAVVTAISTATDLRDMLRSVLDVIMELLPIQSGIIFLLDPTRAQLTLGSHRGVPATYTDLMQSFAISGSACEEVVRYGQPTLRPLIEERGEGELLRHGLESCAYLPLLAGGTVVGAMGLYGDMMLYKEIDMARLMPLGNQVGFAIANVRLYEDSQIERRKLNTVINSIAEGVVLCDSEGRLVLANEAAMELLSLEAVPYDQPLSEMSDFYGIRDLEGQPLPVEQLPMARALSGETFHDYRVLIHGVSGHNSVMSFSGAPAGTDTIEGAVVIFRDITSNQRLERAKDEFLAIAAHELRSPLAAVRSYAEMLLRRERQRNEEDSRDVRGLSILSQQVTHMLRMVDNLLDVSRLDAGQLDLQLQRINLVSLATQVLDQQRPAAPEHSLLLETAQPELWVECDSMRVRQVLTNLVSNAIKYSPPQTSIVVNLTTRMAVALENNERPDQGQSLSIELGQSNHVDSTDLQPPTTREALVSVADQGGGIDSDKQARLFERFYRIRSRRAEGLGLGLYLSREFVLMHGGHIWVESTEGKGSTFCFTLPMREE